MGSHQKKRFIDNGNIIYKIRWAITKIRNRDLGYLPRRISYSIKRRFIDFSFSIQQKNRKYPFKNNIPADSIKLINYFRTRGKPIFHFQSDHIDPIIKKISENDKYKTIKAATEILNNRFVFRNIGPVTMNPTNWNFSPDEASGGWRWDLNRHFFFATLGFAYWYTKDIRFARKFFELSSSWIESNSDKLGRIEWDTPFEVAARINAWIWAYFLFLPCLEWEPISHKQYLCALHKLTNYLYQAIEYHNPGNHIMLEAKALALSAGLFPEFKKCDRWEKKAWKILNEELTKQICEDGVHAERSSMYHRIVAGELAELALFCKNNGIKSETLNETVFRMANFLSWIAGDVQDMPVLGDGYVEDSYFRFWAPAILEARNPASNIPIFSFLGSLEQSQWATGGKSENEVSSPMLQKVISTTGKAFPEGGYFVSRWNSSPLKAVLIWDCGPVGYYANPYHSHLDALSIVLAVKGTQFLIDPGTDELEINKNRLLRQTAAHNTVIIDGEDQSILAPLGRRSEVWSPARATVHTWATCAEFDIMAGSHDGYCRLPLPVSHKRTIISMKGLYWLILDELAGSGVHTAEQRFHVAPGILIEEEPSSRTIKLIREDKRVYFCPISPADPHDKNCFADVFIEPGFAGLLPYKIENIKVIVAKQRAHMPFDMIAIIAPEESNIINTKVMSHEKGVPNDFIVIEVRCQQFCDILCIQHGLKKGEVFYNDFRSDAEIVIIRERNGGRKDVYALGASFLVYKSKELSKEINKTSFKELLPENKNIWHLALE